MKRIQRKKLCNKDTKNRRRNVKFIFRFNIKKFKRKRKKNKKTKFNLNYICYKCLIFFVVKEGN